MLQMVDEIAPELGGEEIIAQTCHGTYVPRNFATTQFFTPADFRDIVARARIIVAHAGMGTIISAMADRKPLVVVPRKAALREHRNDHQQATADNLSARANLAVANNAAELLDAIRRAPLPDPLAPGPSDSLLQSIIDFIEN